MLDASLATVILPEHGGGPPAGRAGSQGERRAAGAPSRARDVPGRRRAPLEWGRRRAAGRGEARAAGRLLGDVRLVGRRALRGCGRRAALHGLALATRQSSDAAARWACAEARAAEGGPRGGGRGRDRGSSRGPAPGPESLEGRGQDGPLLCRGHLPARPRGRLAFPRGGLARGAPVLRAPPGQLRRVQRIGAARAPGLRGARGASGPPRQRGDPPTPRPRSRSARDRGSRAARRLPGAFRIRCGCGVAPGAPSVVPALPDRGPRLLARAPSRHARTPPPAPGAAPEHVASLVRVRRVPVRAALDLSLRRVPRRRPERARCLGDRAPVRASSRGTGGVDPLRPG